MKIVAITQARYGSTRLPAKVLKEVNGLSLLEIHVKRILKSELISKLIIATTKEPGAEHILAIAKKAQVPVFQGSTEDVLDRFYQAALPEQPDYVVRVTSDCPLIDPVEIDRVIRACVSSGADYVSNTLIPTFPDGVDCEVFKFEALEKAFLEATLKSDREHVTPYIWRNSSVKGGSIFKSGSIENPEDYSAYRITVDTQEDFEVIKQLLEALGPDKSWKEYIDYLDRHEKIKELNGHHTRNEGYQKSLLND